MPVTFLHFWSPYNTRRRVMDAAIAPALIQICDVNPEQPNDLVAALHALSVFNYFC